MMSNQERSLPSSGEMPTERRLVRTETGSREAERKKREDEEFSRWFDEMWESSKYGANEIRKRREIPDEFPGMFSRILDTNRD